MAPLATEANQKGNSNNTTTTNFLKRSFYETAQTVSDANLNPNPRIPIQNKISNKHIVVPYSPQRYEKMNTQRIQKKITALNNDIFRNRRHVSTINAPPFETSQNCNWTHLTRDILSMSPLMKKKKDYYLSDIMKNSYTNRQSNNKKKKEEKPNESIKEMRRQNDDLHMKEFMTKFANPAFRRFICGKMRTIDKGKVVKNGKVAK